MKLTLSVIYGILIWSIIYIGTSILTPLFSSSFPGVNILVPLIQIISIGFFGILYIRDIDSNEVIEGFLAGVVFAIVNIIMDNIFLVNNAHNLIFSNYSLHAISTVILTLLITTFLGYLAQMTIDLK
ncbi:hypothetical protein [Methanobrevibacter sp.]|uniref:hypothetical protein n=1 Tax=Methanobrevibacter sp. TaxID=66852 RepID=UPI00388FDF34